MKKSKIILLMLLFTSSCIMAQTQLGFTIPVCPTNTSISDYHNDNQIFVYPNPFSTSIFIDIDGDIIDVKIEVYNIIGTLMLVQKYSNEQRIELSTVDLQKGIYLIIITNEIMSFRKIIINQ